VTWCSKRVWFEATLEPAFNSSMARDSVSFSAAPRAELQVNYGDPSFKPDLPGGSKRKRVRCDTSKKVRALIVDDERWPAAGCADCLGAADPDIEVVRGLLKRQGSRHGDRAGLPTSFPDAQMPEVDGFQVLEALNGSRLPLIIFVTALRSLCHQGVESMRGLPWSAFLNKRRFQAAVERAKERLRSESAGEIERRAPSPLLDQLETKAKLCRPAGNQIGRASPFFSPPRRSIGSRRRQICEAPRWK